MSAIQVSTGHIGVQSRILIDWTLASILEPVSNKLQFVQLEVINFQSQVWGVFLVGLSEEVMPGSDVGRGPRGASLFHVFSELDDI